jgi:hypothetical protein
MLQPSSLFVFKLVNTFSFPPHPRPERFVMAKRLGLFHDLVPKAVRIAVLINPANAPTAETTSRETSKAAHDLGLQIQDPRYRAARSGSRRSACAPSEPRS